MKSNLLTNSFLIFMISGIIFISGCIQEPGKKGPSQEKVNLTLSNWRIFYQTTEKKLPPEGGKIKTVINKYPVLEVNFSLDKEAKLVFSDPGGGFIESYVVKEDQTGKNLTQRFHLSKVDCDTIQGGIYTLEVQELYKDRVLGTRELSIGKPEIKMYFQISTVYRDPEGVMGKPGYNPPPYMGIWNITVNLKNNGAAPACIDKFEFEIEGIMNGEEVSETKHFFISMINGEVIEPPEEPPSSIVLSPGEEVVIKSMPHYGDFDFNSTYNLTLRAKDGKEEILDKDTFKWETGGKP